MRQLKINLNISVNHFNAHEIRRESGQRSFVKSIETASRKTIPFLLDTRYENTFVWKKCLRITTAQLYDAKRPRRFVFLSNTLRKRRLSITTALTIKKHHGVSFILGSANSSGRSCAALKLHSFEGYQRRRKERWKKLAIHPAPPNCTEWAVPTRQRLRSRR